MMTREELQARLTAPQVIALTSYGEARGESVLGLAAVISVIRNRIASGKWGATAQQVCLKPWQFSVWNDGELLASVLEGIARQWWQGDQPEADDIVLRTCLWLSEQAYPSPVRDATHYYATTIAAPAWTRAPAVCIATIGRHKFYSQVT